MLLLSKMERHGCLTMLKSLKRRRVVWQLCWGLRWSRFRFYA